MKHKLAIGSFVLFLAVTLGAFGAHGLSNILTDKLLKTYQTGISYHFYHGFALLLLPLLDKVFAVNLNTPWKLHLIGIIFFSSNCYIYAITQIKLFALLVPIGGVFFLLGWLLTAIKFFKAK